MKPYLYFWIGMILFTGVSAPLSAHELPTQDFSESWSPVSFEDLSIDTDASVINFNEDITLYKFSDFQMQHLFQTHPMFVSGELNNENARIALWQNGKPVQRPFFYPLSEYLDKTKPLCVMIYYSENDYSKDDERRDIISVNSYNGKPNFGDGLIIPKGSFGTLIQKETNKNKLEGLVFINADTEELLVLGCMDSRRNPLLRGFKASKEKRWMSVFEQAFGKKANLYLAHD